MNITRTSVAFTLLSCALTGCLGYLLGASRRSAEIKVYEELASSYFFTKAMDEYTTIMLDRGDPIRIRKENVLMQLNILLDYNLCSEKHKVDVTHLRDKLASELTSH